ncbi:MAG: cell division ATP-binding protein FtsE [Candidatus Levybacteria bacterium RIFCSPHIGHO2_01_FULL_41_15]|nr:MAG: cell division ATP-binding protein FtsE [Candidatus Levybacteria bacterium RIFCSPHIGHO2_01_FULL_41_15]
MIKLDKVSKQFGTGSLGLSDVTLAVDKKEFVFLVGPTGSGKTTIFKLLIREILPTEGNVIVNDWDLMRLPKDKIPHLRKKIGVVFQDLKLLFDRTVFENVMLPLEVSGINFDEAKKKVEEILSQVGLIDHKDKFPIQLSGGELQRAAIARALVLSPDILLADEPTGNLDPATSWEIVKLLSDINERGTTVIMASHNTDIVKNMGKRVVTLERGKLIRDDRQTEKKEEDKKDK